VPSRSMAVPLSPSSSSAAAMVHDVWKKSACSRIGGTPIEWGSYDGQANS